MQCIVHNCENTDDPETGGEFVGNICSPCHEYITTGKGDCSQAYRNGLETAWYTLLKPHSIEDIMRTIRKNLVLDRRYKEG